VKTEILFKENYDGHEHNVSLFIYDESGMDLHCQTGSSHHKAIEKATKILNKRGLSVGKLEFIGPTGAYYPVEKIKVEKMTKLKSMKFKVGGDVELTNNILDQLKKMGYKTKLMGVKTQYIYAHFDATITHSTSPNDKFFPEYPLKTYDDIKEKDAYANYMCLKCNLKMLSASNPPSCHQCGIFGNVVQYYVSIDKSNGTDKTGILTGHTENGVIKVDEFKTVENEYNINFQTAMELAEKEGKKFLGEKIDKDTVFYYDEFHGKHSLKDIETGIVSSITINFNFVDQMFKEYKPEPKIISWFRPKHVWHESDDFHTLYTGRSYKSKEEYNPSSSVKVVEWIEEKHPETWEQCE